MILQGSGSQGFQPACLPPLMGKNSRVKRMDGRCRSHGRLRGGTPAATKRPPSCPPRGELGKSGGFVVFIFVVVGGAERTRRQGGNAAVLAELSRPAGSRKAWTGLGGGRCWFSTSKISARAQARPGSAGHTAGGTASLAKEQRPLPSSPSSASISNALAKLPQRLRLEKKCGAGCEREVHGGCQGRGDVPRLCPRGSVAARPPPPARARTAWKWGNRCKPAEIWCLACVLQAVLPR